MISPASPRKAVSSSRGATVSTVTCNCACKRRFGPGGSGAIDGANAEPVFAVARARKTNAPLSGFTRPAASHFAPWSVDTCSCTSTGCCAGFCTGSMRKGIVKAFCRVAVMIGLACGCKLSSAGPRGWRERQRCQPAGPAVRQSRCSRRVETFSTAFPQHAASHHARTISARQRA